MSACKLKRSCFLYLQPESVKLVFLIYILAGSGVWQNNRKLLERLRQIDAAKRKMNRFRMKMQ